MERVCTVEAGERFWRVCVVRRETGGGGPSIPEWRFWRDRRRTDSSIGGPIL
jgi:hypothetical protein